MPVSVGELLAYLRLDSSGFDRGISTAQTQMRTATGTADRMGAAVGTTSERLTGAGRAAQVAASGSAKYRAAQLSLVAAQERYNAVLNQGSASTGKLASAEASVIRANERVAASSRSATGAVTGLADAQRGANEGAVRTASGFAGAARSAIGLGAAFGAFELARKAIDIGKEASQFQKQMLLIQTQSSASAAEVKVFSSQVLDMAGQVATSPEKLATSLYHVYSTGLKAGQAIDVVHIAAEGAKVGNADLEETTNALTATVVSGIGGIKDMGSAMGMLNTIVGAGDMKLSDLNDALAGGILTAAKGFGVSMQEVGAALAVFGDNNVRGADAATQLRMSILALAKAPKGGQAALDGIGMSAARLKDDMASGGLTKAIDDLDSHMSKAGITGKKVGGFILDAFGRKAGIGLSTLIEQAQRFHIKLDEIGKGGASFADAWKATTQTTSFQFAKLGAEAESAGIVLMQKAMPAVAGVAGAIGRLLPAAIGAAHGALMPFVAGWDMLSSVLGPVVEALGKVLSFLSPVLPVVNAVAGGVLAMWLAFKGYQAARAALFAIQDGIARMATGARNGLATMRSEFGATNAQMATQSAIMRSEFASVEAAALADAAATDRAAAMKAVAYADMAAASTASTDAQVAAADEAAAAALLQARASVEAAATSAAAATEAATAIETAGAEAGAGWSAMLGPLGLAAIGILTIASMFHRSSGASKEATAAAKAYTDALSGGGNKTTVIDSITKQLTNAKLPENLRDLSKALGTSAFTGKQFVTAIQQGGKPLDDLRDRLKAIVKEGTSFSTVSSGRTVAAMKVLTPAAEAAQKALGHLNTQYMQLTKATTKDLLDTKAFAGVSASIDKVSESTKVASSTAKQYAAMMGISVDKNGVAAVSAKDLAAAVTTVSHAYNTASASGSDFLAALDTFSKSAGTAADRAAMIGATLKANAGDALGFAAAINATATANKQFGTDIKQNAAQAVKGGESTRAYLQSIVNLKNGSIDYHRAASAPLIADLQSIQSNAIAAASATYQHNRSLMGGKAAADTAVAGYMGVERSLEGQLTKLTGSSRAAKDLTLKYLGVPKNVRTAIEQEGANPIVDVLNRIGQLLANLTGQTWDIGVNVIVDKIINATAGVRGTKGSDPRLSGRASGGGLPEGVSSVGEQGAELAVKHGSNVQILSHSQSKAYLSKTGMKAPGFASGTLNPHSFLTSLGKDASSEKYAFQQILAVGTKAGISSGLAKELTAENKRIDAAITVRNRLADKLSKDNQRLADAQKLLADEAAAVKGAITGSFDITTAGTGFDGQQPITGQNMVAEEKQDANRARAFVAAIKSLKGKIGAGYLYQLAEKGPSALPEAQALLTLNRSDLAAFNGAASSLNTSGNTLGSYIGDMRFGGAVRTDKHTVAADEARLKAENKSIDRLGNRILKQLEHGIEHLSNPHITVYLDGKKIATAVAKGAKKNGVRS